MGPLKARREIGDTIKGNVNLRLYLWAPCRYVGRLEILLRER